MKSYVYIFSFIVFFAIAVKVFIALNVEQLFKKGKVWEIKAFVAMASLIFAHLLASFMVQILELNLFGI